MKPFTFIFLLLTIWGTGCVSRNNNVCDDQGRFVQLDVENKKYEHIFMKVVDTTPAAHYVTGKSTDGCRWTFNIPDSISQDIWGLHFFFTSGGDTLGITFAAVLENDTLTSSVNNFENNSDTLLIKGVYMNNDSVFHSDVLEVDLKEKIYMTERMQYPGFAFFYDSNNEKKYDDFMDDYTLKIKANPNSIYYISNLSVTFPYFRSTNDIEKLFDLFSPALKNSGYGKRIYEYLNPVFENIKLPLVNDKNVQEPLILDFTKYNLIELTASWCIRCHEIIPALKEISEQYKDKLIITYVTVDDEDDIVNFRKQVEKDSITWRSLWLINNKDNFLYTSSVAGIPRGILVNPTGEITGYFNFNSPEDLKKFHSFLQYK